METVLQLKNDGLFMATSENNGPQIKIIAQQFYPGDDQFAYDFSLPDPVMMTHILNKYEARHGIKIKKLNWLLTNGLDEVTSEYLPISNESELKSFLKINEEKVAFKDVQYQFLEDQCLLTTVRCNQRQIKSLERLCNAVHYPLGWVDLDENSFSKWLWPVDTPERAVVFVIRHNGLWAMSFHHGHVQQSYTSYRRAVFSRDSEREDVDHMMAQVGHIDIFAESNFEKPFRTRIEESVYQFFNDLYPFICDEIAHSAKTYFIDEVFLGSKTLEERIEEYCNLAFEPLPQMWQGAPIEFDDWKWLSVWGGLLRE